MPLTTTELRAWFAREHPGWNWDNRCAGAAYQTCVATGRAVRTYPTATAARNASVVVSRDVAAAPPGAFHFWEYWATLGGVYANYGHVALSLGGGLALMSNPEAWDEQWGIALGVTDVTAWTTRRQGIVTYLGWARSYGENTATITTESAAGDDNRPFEQSEEDDMAGLIQHKDRGIALIAPGYFKAVTPEELQIAVARYGWPKVYDDSEVGAREFDLDVSLAVNGSGGDQQVREQLAATRDQVLAAVSKLR